MVSFDGNGGNSGNIKSSSSDSNNSSNNNSDSKKLQIFRQQASAVSHALWPSNLHRSQVIGKSVKKHRRIAISSLHLLWSEQNAPAAIPVLLVVTSTIVGGSIVTALLLHLWYVLLLPTLLLTLTTLIIMQPLLTKLHAQSKQTMHTRLSIQSTPRTFKSSPGIPPARRSPETPMPKTPLVRELETFDLSETNVEHFLDVNSGSGIRERGEAHMQRVKL
ncbi:MAG TPA: hypothetical protein VKR42_07085 [Ktedonobacteraceae bacterium]|nr:hypothetical protein [Ktedonobacteraceae bacterium]